MLWHSYITSAFRSFRTMIGAPPPTNNLQTLTKLSIFLYIWNTNKSILGLTMLLINISIYP